MTFEYTDSKIQDVLRDRRKTSYYTLTNDWFNGFIEAEGSFLETREGRPYFQCTQHPDDHILVCAIREFVGQGRVTKSFRDDGRSLSIYTLRGIDNLEEYLLPLLQEPVHTSTCKKKLLPWLDKHFPSFSFVAKRSISGEWLAGFTDGDGSFYTTVRKQADYRSGYQFQAVFDLAQLGGFSGENGVLNLIQDLWFSHLQMQRNKGNKRDKSQVDHLRLVRPQPLYQYIVPLYDRYRLRSRKEIQFGLWKVGVKLLIDKKHLEPGFKEVLAYRLRCKKWLKEGFSKR